MCISFKNNIILGGIKMKKSKNLIRKKASRLVSARISEIVKSEKLLNDTLSQVVLKYSKLASEKALMKNGVTVDYTHLEDLASDLIVDTFENKALIISKFNKYFNDSSLKDRDMKIKYGLTLDKALSRSFFYYVDSKNVRYNITRWYFKYINKGITQSGATVETTTLDTISYRLNIDIETKAVKSTIELFESLNNTEKNNLILYFKVQNDETAGKHKRYNALRKIKDMAVLKNIDQDIFIETLENFQLLAGIWDYLG
jgi:hypothetical protein